MGYAGDQKRAYQNEWIQQRRQAWIESQGGKCVTCGSTDRLEVDHIDRTTKTMYPREIWSRTAAVREAELSKCQVLCNKCHNDKTAAENTFPCGTRAKYRAGCKCQPCRDSEAAYRRELRSR